MSGKIKRHRPSLVCDNCKRKKIRCDKLQPCTQCVKAKLSGCNYTARAVPVEKVSLPYMESARHPLTFVASGLATANGENRTNDALPPPNVIGNGIGNGISNGDTVNQFGNGIVGNGSTANGSSVPLTTTNGNAIQNEASGVAGNMPTTVTIPISELELLKARLNQIESSLKPNVNKVIDIDSFISSKRAADDLNGQANNETYGPERKQQKLSQSPDTPLGLDHIAGHAKQVLGANTVGSADSRNTEPTPEYNRRSLTDSKVTGYTAQRTLFAEPFSSYGSQLPEPKNNRDFTQRPLFAPSPMNTGQFLDSATPNYSSHPHLQWPNTPLATNPVSMPIQLPPINFKPSNSYSPMYSDMRGNYKQNAINSNGSATSVSSVISPYSTSSASSVDSMSLIGVNPYSREDDSINFYEGYSGLHIKDVYSSISYGPFAWSSIMKRDKALNLLWECVSKKSKGKVDLDYSNIDGPRINHDKSNDYSVVPESTFQKRANEVDDNGDLKPYTSMEKKPMSFTNQDGIRLGLTYYDGKLDRELELIERIRIILPNKNIIWKLINRFFTYVYLFTPFVDQECFEFNITRIIGSTTEEEILISKLNVENRLDLAYLGMLLIMLRLSYLSYFFNDSAINEYNLTNNDPSPEARELKYLLSNPISINIIDLARECFDQFQFLKRSSFPVLQLAMFIKLYSVYAPEEGVDDSDPQTFGGIILYMAYQVGLNREPDKLNSILQNPRINNLRRKMWSYIRLWDSHYACTAGNTMMINPNSFDTKLPYHVPGNENVSDVVLDKFLTETYSDCWRQHSILLKILDQVLNVQGRTKMRDLCANLTEFENEVQSEYGSLAECLKPFNNADVKFIFTNTLRAKCYLFYKAFLMSIYFYFYLRYEDSDLDLSFFYLKKLMFIAAEIMPCYKDLLAGTNRTCDMIINPSLQNIIAKANQLNFSLIIRINIRIHQMKTLTDHIQKCSSDEEYMKYYQALCRLSSYLTRCAEISIAGISTLSNRYYFAWRITKGHTFLLKTITSVDFYKDYKPSSELQVPHFTLSQIEDFLSICEVALCKSESGFDKCKGQFTVGAESERYYGMCTGTDPNSEPTANPQGNGTNNINFVDSEEIDQLWFQMLSKKYDKLQYNDTYPENDKINSTDMSASTISNTPGWIPTKAPIDIHSFDIEQSTKYDIFSDLPFDQIFK